MTFARRWRPELGVLLLALASAGAAPSISRSTPHLTFKATLSSDTVAAGGRLTLQLDVVPKKGMHVYAPGTQYRAIAVRLDANTLVKASPAVYPKPERYVFKPLQEEVLVYSAPFRLMVDLGVAAVSPPAATSRLKIAGVVTYQACDDRVCYLPQAVPIEWTIRLLGI